MHFVLTYFTTGRDLVVGIPPFLAHSVDLYVLGRCAEQKVFTAIVESVVVYVVYFFVGRGSHDLAVHLDDCFFAVFLDSACCVKTVGTLSKSPSPSDQPSIIGDIDFTVHSFI